MSISSISIKQESAPVGKSTSVIVPEQEESWSVLADALGYPETWMAVLRSNLSSVGKAWRWQKVEASQATVVRSVAELQPQAAQLEQGGKILLIVNAKTENKSISNALLLADNCNASVSVIYTAKPPVLSEDKTSSEVDSDFVHELEYGRNRLQHIEKEAKELGVKINTQFIWSNSSSELVKKKKSSADLVIDEAV